jgi:hypothetical protein
MFFFEFEVFETKGGGTEAAEGREWAGAGVFFLC